jgi:hypothetical protein
MQKQIAVAGKKHIPRPRRFEADVMAAEELYRTQQLIPPRLWAAWVGRIAGLQVNQPCFTASGDCAGFGTENGAGDPYNRPVAYLRPSEIAAKLHRLIGTPNEIFPLKQLSDMVMWLDSQDQRNYCFEAIGMLANDEHDPPGRAVIQRAIRDLAVKQTVMEIESPPAREIRERVKSSPVLTEPAEVFEAIKPPIVYAEPNGPGNPLREFFPEEAAA